MFLHLAGTHRKRHALGLSRLQTFLDCLANITILSFSVLCYISENALILFLLEQL